jgi:hypothetical protein
MTREELIAALEAAEGPDTGLDHRIQEQIEGWRNIGGGWREWSDGKREKYNYILGSPPYTSSLDAALSLVPEDMFWSVDNSSSAFICVIDADHQRRSVRVGDGATPAIALCIASLKARPS